MTGEQLNAAISALPSSGTNVTTALERIKGLRDILAQHGLELDLNTPENSQLETIVREYNKIVKQLTPNVRDGELPGAITVDNKTHLKVAAGYYTSDFYVTGSNSQEDQDEAIKQALNDLKRDLRAQLPTPEQVIAGAPAVYFVQTPQGELIIQNTTGTVGSSEDKLIAGTADSQGNLIVKTTRGDSLQSTIPYHDDELKEVQIVVKEQTQINGESELVTLLDANTLPSGYYSKPVKISPVLNVGENTNKVVNIQQDKTIYITEAKIFDITPDEGFDYLKNAKAVVPEGSSKISASIAGNVVKLTPTFTQGWIDETIITGAEANKDGSYYITLPTNSAEDGKATVEAKDINNDNKPEVVVNIPEGYYDGNTSIPVVIKTGNTEKTVEYITEVPNITVEDGTPELVIPAGLYPTTTLQIIDKSQLTIDTTEVEDAVQQVLNSKITYVSTNKGYTEGEAKKLAIVDSSTPILTSKRITDPETNQQYDKVIVNIANGGWAEGETDVSSSFANLADQYSNGFVDRTNGQDSSEEVSTDGQVLFTYAENLDEVSGGIQIKVPVSGNRYFTSAKVDLSALITDIDNI